MGASLIASLLKWTGLSQGVMELIAAGVLLSGIGGVAAYEHHKIYTEGVKAEVAKVQKQSAADAKILEQRATTAESNYAKAQKQLADFNQLNPVEPVRLCVRSPAGNGLQAPPADTDSGSAAPATAPVQPVPAGDSAVRQRGDSRDISDLLRLLAERADQVTNQARELQGTK